MTEPKGICLGDVYFKVYHKKSREYFVLCEEGITPPEHAGKYVNHYSSFPAAPTPSLSQGSQNCLSHSKLSNLCQTSINQKHLGDKD